MASCPSAPAACEAPAERPVLGRSDTNDICAAVRIIKREAHMPDISNIDSEKILGAAGQLDGVADRINGCVMKFADAIEALDKGWVSEVKAGFMDTYRGDMDAMQEMISQLYEINTGLREAATDFDKTEGDIVSSVGALRQ